MFEGAVLGETTTESKSHVDFWSNATMSSVTQIVYLDITTTAPCSSRYMHDVTSQCRPSGTQGTVYVYTIRVYM